MSFQDVTGFIHDHPGTLLALMLTWGALMLLGVMARLKRRVYDGGHGYTEPTWPWLTRPLPIPVRHRHSPVISMMVMDTAVGGFAAFNLGWNVLGHLVSGIVLLVVEGIAWLYNEFQELAMAAHENGRPFYTRATFGFVKPPSESSLFGTWKDMHIWAINVLGMCAFAYIIREYDFLTLVIAHAASGLSDFLAVFLHRNASVDETVRLFFTATAVVVCTLALAISVASNPFRWMRKYGYARALRYTFHDVLSAAFGAAVATMLFGNFVYFGFVGFVIGAFYTVASTAGLAWGAAVNVMAPRVRHSPTAGSPPASLAPAHSAPVPIDDAPQTATRPDGLESEPC